MESVGRGAGMEVTLTSFSAGEKSGRMAVFDQR
jgi:hypothetical protein